MGFRISIGEEDGSWIVIGTEGQERDSPWAASSLLRLSTEFRAGLLPMLPPDTPKFT